MKSEIKTICPHCSGTAFYYPFCNALGCLVCGWIPYNEIPKELYKHHKSFFVKLVEKSIKHIEKKIAKIPLAISEK